MTFQSTTIDPATTTPAADISKIKNDLSVLKGVIGGTPDGDVPSKMVSKTLDTGSAVMPAGTTGQRDGSPAAGYLRYNATLGRFEGYGTAWGSLGGATGGGVDDAFYENTNTITTNYTISTGKNAMSAGPITVNNGITVTVPNGSVWSVI